MPRHPLLLLSLLLLPAMGPTPNITGLDWQLLAIDGRQTDAPATFRVEADGSAGGAAPCNRWSASGAASLPALDLRAIRATRMACDRLADEQLFFDALSVMTALELDGPRNLILTGPDGRSMEFVLDRSNSATVCKTCRPDG